MGTSNKLPKLLQMEDYPSWADKFKTYIQALNYETWTTVKEEYIIPKNENGSNYRLSMISEALLTKDRGNPDIRKSNMALLKKEFDIFTQVKGETFAQLVERYCHLVNEMKRLGTDKPDYEYIDKLADALPEEWGTFIMIQ
ncbi:uncharacterized protein LOC143622533 [Bidens hawaiensis]|uniref:uncharacterized protein LOC143622533 n=1 Tax=Bidens hawaiensis TaxID=980011 RepID=UPI00404AE377